MEYSKILSSEEHWIDLLNLFEMSRSNIARLKSLNFADSESFLRFCLGLKWTKIQSFSLLFLEKLEIPRFSRILKNYIIRKLKMCEFWCCFQIPFNIKISRDAVTWLSTNFHSIKIQKTSSENVSYISFSYNQHTQGELHNIDCYMLLKLKNISHFLPFPDPFNVRRSEHIVQTKKQLDSNDSLSCSCSLLTLFLHFLYSQPNHSRYEKHTCRPNMCVPVDYNRHRWGGRRLHQPFPCSFKRGRWTGGCASDSQTTRIHQSRTSCRKW